MCGITFCIKGVSPQQIQYLFDIFELFRENPSNNFALSSKAEEYSKYIQEKKLFISDFSPKDIFETISNRGPDCFQCVKLLLPYNDSEKPSIIKITTDSPDFSKNIFEDNTQEKQKYIEIILAGAVLHLRGEYNSPNPQPLIDEETFNCLLYNGEIFNIEKSYFQNLSKLRDYSKIMNLIEEFNPFLNDTKQLFNILNSYSIFYNSETKEGKKLNYQEDMKLIMDCFNADFAFIFVDVLNRKITFGKDIFGKRSLLIGTHPNGLCLSSCSIKPNASTKDLQEEAGDEEEEVKTNKEKPNNDERDHNMLIKEEWKQAFLEKKYNNEYFMSLEKNWVEIPANKLYQANIEITLDSVLKMEYIRLAGWRHKVFEEESKSAYEADIQTASTKVSELIQASIKNLLQNIISYKPYFKDHKNEIIPEVNQDNNNMTNSQVAILFSGGLDSALIALISSMILPEGTRYDQCTLD